MAGAHDRCRTPVRKPIGTTALASGVWVEGPYLSLHHGQVRRRGVSISGLRSVVFKLSDGEKGKVHFCFCCGHWPCCWLVSVALQQQIAGSMGALTPLFRCCKASALGKCDSAVMFQYTCARRLMTRIQFWNTLYKRILRVSTLSILLSRIDWRLREIQNIAKRTFLKL